MLAKLFNNFTLLNYNIENMINNDPPGMKALLDKMINDSVKSLDNGGADIADTKVNSLYNLVKQRNNYKALSKGNIINNNQTVRLKALYDSLVPKIGEPLKPILAQIKGADKAKKEKDEVAEYENKILDLQKQVRNCLEIHKRSLLDYDNMYRLG